MAAGCRRFIPEIPRGKSSHQNLMWCFSWILRCMYHTCYVSALHAECLFCVYGITGGSLVNYCHEILLQIRHFNSSTALQAFRGTLLESVPQVVEVVCHHSNAQTNKPTKRDGRVGPLISPLHNADKASAGPPIG